MSLYNIQNTIGSMNRQVEPGVVKISAAFILSNQSST
jgi:hypothetical protein